MFFTSPYRKDHLRNCPQPAGVQWRRWRWYSLRCGQFTASDHHLEAQGRQDPGCQRRWASPNINVPMLELLFSPTACHPIPSHPPDSLSSHHTFPPVLSASSCFPINLPHSSSSPSPPAHHLWTKPCIFSGQVLDLRWCMNMKIVFFGHGRSGYCH